MVNDITDAISAKLYGAFGMRIYSGEVEQNLKEPCFIIRFLGASETRGLGNRYFRQNPFDVHYFPAKRGSVSETEEMAAALYGTLEYVTLPNGDILRGTKLRHETQDGVLHFFVEYNAYIRKTKAPADNMEQLAVDAGVTLGG